MRKLAVSVTMVMALTACDPEGGNKPAPTQRPVLELTPKPTAVQPGVPGGAPLFYKNCGEAREAGAAPMPRIHPGYDVRLDPNRNGMACEEDER